MVISGVNNLKSACTTHEHYRWVSARVGYAASAGPTINRGARRWLYPRQGPEVPRRGLVRSHRWQEHARGRRSEMLCLWTESGAHNVLQVRTKVLNNQLRGPSFAGIRECKTNTRRNFRRR